MDAENVCSMCQSPAQAFCDCRSELIFLCGECIGQHWKTQGKHLIQQLVDFSEQGGASLNEKLEIRKKVTLVKTFLSKRLKQIRREYLEFTTRLDSLERDLHQTITNKFKDLQHVLKLSVEKLEQEVQSLQDQIQTYLESQGIVSPLCEKMISKSATLIRLLSEPIGVLLTDLSSVEIQVTNLQSFRCQGLDVTVGGGLPTSALYIIADTEESFKVFDLETKADIGYQLDFANVMAFDSSWCTMANSDVFVCGGTVNIEKLSSACFLHTASLELEETKPMQFARSTHGVIEVEGYIYVFGGEGKRAYAIDLAERFHVDTSSWSAIKPLPQTLTKVSLVAVRDVIYITGYNTFKLFVYCPLLDSYRPISFCFEKSFQSACLLSIGPSSEKLLILRGPEIYICDFAADYDLKMQYKLTQTTHRTDIWEIKGTPAKKDPNYYVYNFHTKSVFEVFVYGLRVEIAEVVDEEDV